jgi:hypothetical protein
MKEVTEETGKSGCRRSYYSRIRLREIAEIVRISIGPRTLCIRRGAKEEQCILLVYDAMKSGRSLRETYRQYL